ncbi:MAG TPA: restriction endonuclease subunit S [Pedobacter sp.]|jgi:type I restriction enzyme S subunit
MNNWPKTRLASLCHRIGDGLHGTPNYKEDGEVYFINGNNLKDGKIVTDPDTKKVTYDEFKKNFIRLNENTLLLGINGSLGNMAFYAGEKVMLGKSSAYLNFKSDVNRFYYYYFQLPGIQKHFLDVATGSTIKNLSLKSLQDFEVPIPPEEEYKKIVLVLSALDDKIELNNNINAELEAMAKTLYDYWFVQFDFPNAEGKPYKFSGGEMVYDEVLKREIPNGWEVTTLGKIANITMGQSPDGTSYNDTGEGLVFYQGSTDFGWRFPTLRQFTTKPTRFAKVGDILLSVRAPVGTFNVAKEDCCIGRGLSAINSKDKFNSFLLYQLSYFKKRFENINSVGTTFGSITKDELHSLVVCYPSPEILSQFESIVSNFDEKIFINSKQNQELASLRDWLLPMLMNGQVKVVEAYKEVEEKLAMVAEADAGYGK